MWFMYVSSHMQNGKVTYSEGERGALLSKDDDFSFYKAYCFNRLFSLIKNSFQNVITEHSSVIFPYYQNTKLLNHALIWRL